MGKKIDLTGQTYGRWLVLNEEGRDKSGAVLWRCKCTCRLGTVRVVRGDHLRNEKSQSCGCIARELLSEHSTTHGLYKSNPRLIRSIRSHFQFLREGGHGYQYWTLDPRYPDNSEGVVMFCMDVIALQPEMCALYEIDKSLDLDKDNNVERIFRPEGCRFVSRKDNLNNRRNTVRLDDGTSLAMFCISVGIQTHENGKMSKQYSRISTAFRRGKIHPELLQKVNDYLNLLKRLKASLDLLAEVREFAHGLQHIRNTTGGDLG